MLQGYGYPTHPLVGTAVGLVFVMLFSPLMTFVRDRSGSVLGPAILHGTADGCVLLTLALVRGGSDLRTGWGSLATVPVLAAVNLAIARAVRPAVAPSVG